MVIQAGVPMSGGGGFYSAGLPGETFNSDMVYQTQGVGIAPGEPYLSAPMYSESFVPVYGPGGALESYKPKGQRGAIMEGGAYLDPVSMQNYANAARQADIYSRIQKRLEAPNNDLYEELERQHEVEYEAVRKKLINDETALLEQAKVEGWDERTTNFLRDSLYAKFAENDAKLKTKYAEVEAQWHFIEKEGAREVKNGESPESVDQAVRRNQMGMLNDFVFPSLVRGEEDRATALADFDARVARGEDPQRAAWMARVPQAVAGGDEEGEREAAITRFNELRGQKVPWQMAAYRAKLDLSKFGIQPDDYTQTEEDLNEMFGPPTEAPPGGQIPEGPIEEPAQGPGGQILDRATALEILNKAGGDKEKARQIARSMGYKF